MNVFDDNVVREARAAGGVIPLGSGRRLLLPSRFGFCGGVHAALTRLQECLESRRQGTLHLLGPIIHNDTVNQHFEGRGVHILPEDDLEAVFEVLAPGDTVVIPAFGVPLELERKLRREFPRVEVVDTTCRYVRRVWSFLEGLAGRIGVVLIHGKAGHPETRATLSRALAAAPHAVLVPALEHVDGLLRCLDTGRWASYPERLSFGTPVAGGEGVALVNQTTMLHDETMALGACLRAWGERTGRPVTLADTVCHATQDRQDAARRVCALGPDVVVVVGSPTSSNTTQLYRLAAAAAPTYLVRGAVDVRGDRVTHFVPGQGWTTTADWLPRGWRTVAVLAGASCPEVDVGGAIQALRSGEDTGEPGANTGGPEEASG
ncbi:MAG: hypothetical protein JXR77_09300 [Lentisphaeria bacterium]|nr:hypothetical protein [Lentisphaeria bacterium]